MQTETVRSHRELDALIAEHLMGWSWYQWFGNSEQRIIAPSEEYANEIEFWGRDVRFLVPRYSSDIVAAWAIESQIPDKDAYAAALMNQLEIERLRFDRGLYEDDVFQIAFASPLVRCLAALETIGVKVELEIESGP